uniref:Uncharacterized protein n=1 Tax=Anguilla anguilla TaxID=7936 RepID=A0A0E9RGI4_ANGAN
MIRCLPNVICSSNNIAASGKICKSALPSTHSHGVDLMK